MNENWLGDILKTYSKVNDMKFETEQAKWRRIEKRCDRGAIAFALMFISGLCIGWPGLVIAPIYFITDIIVPYIKERKIKSSAEYVKGYKRGYDEDNEFGYNKMNWVLNVCGGAIEERNYAYGYVDGYNAAEKDKETERKRKMCKSGMEFIRKSMDEN